MNKVILINPVNHGRESFRIPFGLLTIATVFIDRGVEVVWVDADAKRDQPDCLEKEILGNLDADLIAMGGLHSCYRSVKEIFQFLESRKIDIPRIVGGKIAQTLDHLLWAKIPGMDMICRQEGENVVKALCDSFPDKSSIPGIEYRKDGAIIKNDPADIVQDLDEIPPFKWDLLDRDRYFKSGTGYILSSRGCPFTCRFCRYSDNLSRNYRSLSAERIILEMEYLVSNYKVHTLCFVDEFFLLKKSRVNVFCDAIEKKNLKIKWVISSRADAIKPGDLPLLKRMKSLGCSHINMGIESGSQEMLDLMEKRLSLKQIETAVRVISKAGIKLKPTFIFAFPGETRQTALDSVKWRISNEPYGLQTVNKKGKYFYATPYPGAPLYDNFIEKFNMDLDKEEQWILKSPSLKEINYNLTDLADKELSELDDECKYLLQKKNKLWRKIKNRYIPRPLLSLLNI